MLEMMKDWKKMVTDSYQTAAADIFQAVEKKGKLSKVAQKRNEFESTLRKVEGEFGLADTFEDHVGEKSRIDKMLRGFLSNQ